MKKIIIIGLFVLFSGVGSEKTGLAQTDTASQAIRTQEILEKEQALREKLNEPQKTYIRKIVVEGASLLTEEEIRQIISPFQKHWLTKQDIQRLIESLKQAYQQKGYAQQAVKISYRVKHKTLRIQVEELTH